VEDGEEAMVGDDDEDSEVDKQGQGERRRIATRQRSQTQLRGNEMQWEDDIAGPAINPVQVFST
jgi:hypothetical protein